MSHIREVSSTIRGCKIWRADPEDSDSVSLILLQVIYRIHCISSRCNVHHILERYSINESSQCVHLDCLVWWRSSYRIHHLYSLHLSCVTSIQLTILHKWNTNRRRVSSFGVDDTYLIVSVVATRFLRRQRYGIDNPLDERSEDVADPLYIVSLNDRRIRYWDQSLHDGLRISAHFLLTERVNILRVQKVFVEDVSTLAINQAYV